MIQKPFAISVIAAVVVVGILTPFGFDCFDSLTAAQVSEFESSLPENFGSSVTTIEQLCDFIAAQSEESVPALIDSVGDILESLPQTIPPPSLQTILAIENCLLEIFG